MADITMCSGEGCPLKDKCYRFTAEPNPHRQSMFMGTPMVKVIKDGKELTNCEHFWKNN